jgi:hypothetical protein
MPIRNPGFTLAVLLAAGCATAPVSSRFERKAPADPDRFERIACLRGELPVELDERAFAQARTADLAAERQARATPQATRRLLAQREAFQSRCSAWLQPVPPGDGMVKGPATPFVTASIQTTR